MRKIIERLLYDLRSLPGIVRSYYHARKNRDVMIVSCRGFRTEKEAKEYLKAIDDMEKKLSFPIINKKNYY